MHTIRGQMSHFALDALPKAPRERNLTSGNAGAAFAFEHAFRERVAVHRANWWDCARRAISSN
jgi:hypothetical protein